MSSIHDVSWRELEWIKKPGNRIKVSLAGHTNIGKTTWLRTLLMNQVGEVADRANVTKAITPEGLFPSDNPYIEFYDVPGQRRFSQVLATAKERYGAHIKPDDLRSLAADRSLRTEMYEGLPEDEQGALDADFNLLEHFFGCHIILFVADCQEDPPEGYLDEVDLLIKTGVPVIGILNYVTEKDDEKHILAWEQHLMSVGTVRYDAFYNCPKSEERLGKLLSSAINKLDAGAVYEKYIQYYWQWRSEERKKQVSKSAELLAEFLVNVGAFRKVKKNISELAVESEKKDLQKRFNHKVGEEILRVRSEIRQAFGFDYLNMEKWGGVSVVSQEAGSRNKIFQVGTGAGTGAVIGGAVGLGIDVACGGLSGGAPTVLGAAVGASLGGMFTHIWDVTYSKKHQRLTVQLTIKVLRYIAADGIEYIYQLSRRGHGNTDSLKGSKRAFPVFASPLYERAGKNPQWSRFSEKVKDSKSRSAFVEDAKRQIELEVQKSHSQSRSGDNKTFPDAIDIVVDSETGESTKEKIAIAARVAQGKASESMRALKKQVLTAGARMLFKK